MQVQQKLFTKLYLPLIKSFHNAVFFYAVIRRALCCLAFLFFLLCSVFKVQVEEYTLKIEQCKTGLSTAKSLPGFRRVTTFE